MAKVKAISFLQPFLKWPGGKRWFITRYADILPKKFNRYIEPFLGSGAVLFYLNPQSAIVGDINLELINSYHMIKNHWEKVETGLIEIQERHIKNRDYYYEQRAEEPIDSIERVLRTIYLNRTCFNGIYRVNKKGKFNVPKGSSTTIVRSTDNFQQRADSLQRVDLRVSDFQPLVEQASEGDFIFADPPYTINHNKGGFTQYNKRRFSWEDQERLACSLCEAKARGAKILVTNANHQCVHDLYSDFGFALRKVSRYSGISASPAGRKPYEELIISANIKIESNG